MRLPKAVIGRFTLGLALVLAAPDVRGLAKTLVADPNATPASADYYRTLVTRLLPGDTLLLPAGTYRERLNLNGLQGTAGAWITITGPETGAPAIVTTDSTCCNTVQLGNTWFVALRNLTIDSNSEGVGESIDGINAKDGPTHDIRIENCTITGVSYHQATVGISTKSTAWNWTIRKNRILRAGTGLYLGNSDGSAPFVAGRIEGNLVVDTIGYNMEIKFQRPYSLPAGMPAGPNRTIIRDNVFMKRVPLEAWPPMKDGSPRISGSRPNVLVGGFPDTGPGSQDRYEIYGNVFYMNPDESLFQGSGRLTLHDNIFVGASGAAIALQNHDLALKQAYVYSNTIYGGATGIRFSNAPSQGDATVGNLVFAGAPITGSISYQKDNLTAPVSAAPEYVHRPSLVLGEMDFFPLQGKCLGSAMDLSLFASDTDYALDFNGTSKAAFVFRGAYSGEGTNPGWQIAESLKSGGSSGPSVPATPRNLRIIR